jgi:aminoglycoside phosphotransferase (APT) family kinase protein
MSEASLPLCDAAKLGPTLEPALIRACDGRLSGIRWFKSDWQRGGGSTGYATLHTDTGPVEAVVKVPVGYTEHKWTTALGHASAALSATPRVYAAGLAINGYDLGWLVMERFPGMPLAGKVGPQAIRDLLAAAARWHAQAATVADPASAPAPTLPDWPRLIHKSREVLRHGAIADDDAWLSALTRVEARLPDLLETWRARPINAWCHGDLHPGNAMRRRLPADNGTPTGPVVLIDLALVHPGHWVEDALYLERIFWGHESILGGVAPVEALADARRALGLTVEPGYAHLAAARRILVAAAAPALVEREGNPRYLQAALGLLQAPDAR